MVQLLFVSSTSACFELQNKSAFYAERELHISLNGKSVSTILKNNVFSFYGLIPNTEYTLTVEGQPCLSFKTRLETTCINVRTRGAIGDGLTDDTNAIQTCIDECPCAGRVYIPKGTYLIRPLTLKSNITLEIAKDALLLGDVDTNAYEVLPAIVTDEKGESRIYSTWEGEAIPSRKSLIHGDDIENTQIIGEGIIDGNAQNSTWWKVEALQRVIGRPRLVFLNRCRNVVLHGITAQNSASWTVHPFFCENIDFLDLKIYAPKISPNTDGLNPESCNNINVIGCKFSTGDDCIAIKSGRIEMAQKFSCVAQRYTIRNCLMEYGHGAVVIGSEISGGTKELSVSQCLFRETDRGIRIKSNRARGEKSILDGLHFENIRMEKVQTPFVINMYYFCGPDGRTELVRSRSVEKRSNIPYVGEISFKDIECYDCEVMAGYFDGLTEQPIKKIVMENVIFHFNSNANPNYPAMLEGVEMCCRKGTYFDNVKEIVLKNVSFENVQGDEVILKSHDSFQRINVIKSKDDMA